MAKNFRRNAFTLIEVLIVVIIMAVLAAVIIPQFADSSRDAKESTLKHNLHALQSQIGLYRMDHLEQYPTIQNDGLPQLTQATDRTGKIGPSGPDYPCGPYLVGELPRNPFDSSNKVTPVAVPGQKPTAAVGALGGWQFDASNGALWPNHPAYYK
jgi:general secretion pathway protein G